jgi:hypothetical protein
VSGNVSQKKRRYERKEQRSSSALGRRDGDEEGTEESAEATNNFIAAYICPSGSLRASISPSDSSHAHSNPPAENINYY